MVAKCIVDVLEVIEIDVEYGCRRAAGANFLDHCLQALAEENAIWQAAERIVHREMAQARFTGRNRCGGTAHVAQYESGKQSETGEGDRNKRHHVVDDFGAWLLRRPREPRDEIALGPREVIGKVAARERILLDHAQIGKPQLRGDAGECAVVDEFDRHDDRRAGVVGRRNSIGGAYGAGGDDGRPSKQPADDRCLRMCAAFGEDRLVQADRAAQARIAAAHEVKHRSKSGTRGGKPLRVGGTTADHRIEQRVIAIKDENVVVVEIGLQPGPDPQLGPLRIEGVANVFDRAFRRGDALHFAQHAFAVVGQRAREQLFFMVDGHDVGALRGR